MLNEDEEETWRNRNLLLLDTAEEAIHKTFEQRGSLKQIATKKLLYLQEDSNNWNF